VNTSTSVPSAVPPSETGLGGRLDTAGDDIHDSVPPEVLITGQRQPTCSKCKALASSDLTRRPEDAQSGEIVCHGPCPSVARRQSDQVRTAERGDPSFAGICQMRSLVG
jgi:hypothetical protein